MAARTPITVEIEGITVIRPGDTLVVGLKRDCLPLDQAEAYKQRLRERMPGLADVVIIGGVTALATYRPDSDAH